MQKLKKHSSMEWPGKNVCSDWVVVMLHFFVTVLGLAGMELISLVAALTGMCWVLVAAKVLRTHQWFGYRWAVLHDIQAAAQSHLPSNKWLDKRN